MSNSIEDVRRSRSERYWSKYVNASSGTPTHYCKYGDFIYLRPNPNYSETIGLIAYFNRPASRFASTDTTKVPGVPVIHIPYLCRLASLPYLLENGKNNASSTKVLISEDEEKIRAFYARRDKDVNPVATPNVEDCE